LDVKTRSGKLIVVRLHLTDLAGSIRSSWLDTSQICAF